MVREHDWNQAEWTKLCKDEVEIRALLPLIGLMKYRKWTKVSRSLAIGLKGIEMREL